jgi:hypothetical protein
MVDNLVAINCASVVKATYAVLPSMLARGRGAIVNISSAAGVPVSLPMVSLYSSTKSFVIQFSLSLSDEYKDKGIDFQVRPPPGIICMSSTGPAREKKQKINQNARHLLQLRVHVSCHPHSVHNHSSKSCSDMSALNHAASVAKVRCGGQLTIHSSLHVRSVLSCKHKINKSDAMRFRQSLVSQSIVSPISCQRSVVQKVTRTACHSIGITHHIRDSHPRPGGHSRVRVNRNEPEETLLKCAACKHVCCCSSQAHWI